jgi:tetratricopeptide (TPR) repeat protein
MSEIGDALYEDILVLCQRGDGLADEGRYPEALASYWSAWDLLPEPKTALEAARWILAAIGDANFLAGDFVAGRDNQARAMHCPGAIGNPFLHLRLGQCRFELGELDRAADDLARAILLEGDRIFVDEHPKYLAFIKSRLDAPAGEW